MIKLLKPYAMTCALGIVVVGLIYLARLVLQNLPTS